MTNGNCATTLTEPGWTIDPKRMHLLFCGIAGSRTDLYQVFGAAAAGANVSFLEEFSRREPENLVALSFGKIIYWSDYSSAFDLLDRLRPDKLVFVLLDNYYHFALLFAAKERKIPVVYADHGIRYEEEIQTQAVLDKTLSPGLLARIKRTWPLAWVALLRNRFFRATLMQLDRSRRQQLRTVFFGRARFTYLQFMLRYGKFITPDVFLAYSPTTWRFYQLFFGIAASAAKVEFTGIPALDEFAAYRFRPVSERKALLFIDQPFFEQGLLGWTKQKKLDFLQQLSATASANGCTVWIKPHPWNQPVYQEISWPGDIRIINGNLDQEEVEKHVLWVGSFNSTLLLPFCAHAQVVTFCMENHPLPSNPTIAAGITKHHVAVEINKVGDLAALLKAPDRFIEEKKQYIETFVREVIFSFDGNSFARLSKALLA